MWQNVLVFKEVMNFLTQGTALVIDSAEKRRRVEFVFRQLQDAFPAFRPPPPPPDGAAPPSDATDAPPHAPSDTSDATDAAER